MNHDLLHIQGKPYALVPLHEYRMLTGQSLNDVKTELPKSLLDEIHTGQTHPVRALRKYRGFTQAELAEAAGLSRPYLTEIETGRKEGSIGAVKAIAEALKAPLSLLVA